MSEGIPELTIGFIGDHIFAIIFGFVWLIAGITLQRLGEKIAGTREGS